MVDDSPSNERPPVSPAEPAPVPSKARSVLRLWALALAGSVLLVASGERWPEPLAVQPAVVWSLLLVPPALVALWLLIQWRNPGEGESHH
jgi:hypothetical protein